MTVRVPSAPRSRCSISRCSAASSAENASSISTTEASLRSSARAAAIRWRFGVLTAVSRSLTIVS